MQPRQSEKTLHSLDKTSHLQSPPRRMFRAKEEVGSQDLGFYFWCLLTQPMTLGESFANSAKLKNNSPNKSVPAPSPHYGGATREDWVHLFKNRKAGNTRTVGGELAQCLRLVHAGSWGGEGTTWGPPAWLRPPPAAQTLLKPHQCQKLPLQLEVT